ncbi:MAG: glycosyltransferase family 39 protein [SAR324 cluster bacterium]|nr:glycosyltransferase family 39 protein [SAR324 cluster bacterium]
MKMKSSLFHSPKFSVMVFITLGILYLAGSWVPNEEHRTLYEQRQLIRAVEEGTASFKDGDFSIDGYKLQIRNSPLAPDHRARLVIQFVQSLTILDQFTLEGQIHGPGEVFLKFGKERQYSIRANKDAATGRFFVKGKVIQDHFPELVILGPDPEDPLSPVVEINHLTIHGNRYLSYGIWLLPCLVISFIWLLIVLSPRNIKWIYTTLGMIVFLCAVIRLSFVLNITEAPFSDMASREYIALKLLKGQQNDGFFRSYYFHGLSYYFAAIYYLFGVQNFLALRLANVLLALITTVALYACGRQLSGIRAGLIGAFLFTFSHEMTFWSGKFSTEHLFVCLSIFSLFFVIKAWKQPVFYWFFLAGIALGYSYIVRPVLPFFLLFLLLGFILFHPSQWRKRLLNGSLFCIGFLLVMAPWIIRGYENYGRFLPTSTGGWYVFVHQNNDVVKPGEFGGYEVTDYYFKESRKRFDNEIDASKWVQQEALTWVQTHPWRYLQLSLGRLKMLFVQNGIALSRTHPLELNFFWHSFYYLFHWNVGTYPGTIGGVAWLALLALLLLLIQLPSKLRSRRWHNIFFQMLPSFYFLGICSIHLLATATPRYRAALLSVVFLMIGVALDPVFSWVNSKGQSFLNRVTFLST